MLHLYLLRHAKTNKQSDSGRDFDRTLMDKGIRQGKALSIKVKDLPIAPQHILVSSARRTKQTYDLICQSLNSNQVSFHKELYLADYKTILNSMWNLVDDESPVMIIGHNFGISDLASYLTDDNIHMQTGSLVHLTFELDSWRQISQSKAILVEYYRPEVF